MNQEILIRLSMLEQQTKQLEEHLRLVEQNILEIQTLLHSLDEIDGNKNDVILSQLANGIYMKSKLEEKKFFVDVGSRIIVKKSAGEVKLVIEEQMKKLMNAKNEVYEQLGMLGREMEKLVQQARKEGEKEKK